MLTTFLHQVRAALAPLGNADKAAGMHAYMKGQFAFLGVPTPQRRQATRLLIRDFAGKPLPAARALWREPQREFQYVACDLLAQRANDLPAETLDGVLELVSAKSWWDTVDALTHTVGVMVRNSPALVGRMDQLIDDPDLWRRRVALLHQLGAKGETNSARLFDYCLQRGDEKEFFIRKAIGWALRDYAWHAPATVQDFLDRHGNKLSPLSLREAGRNLKRG